MSCKSSIVFIDEGTSFIESEEFAVLVKGRGKILSHMGRIQFGKKDTT